jgi:hypothetical protein
VAFAQSGSPFDTGFTTHQTLFTGTVAKAASLIAIVIGGYQFAHGEPGAKKALAGVAAGPGMIAVQCPCGDGGFYRTPTTIRDRSSAGGPFCHASMLSRMARFISGNGCSEASPTIRLSPSMPNSCSCGLKHSLKPSV